MRSRKVHQPNATPVAVTVTVRGDVGADVVEYAQAKLGTVGRFTGRAVEHASAVLTLHANPAIEQPAEARAAFHLTGAVVRASASAGTLREAIDGVEDRLQRRIDELDAKRDPRARAARAADRQRHASARPGRSQ